MLLSWRNEGSEPLYLCEEHAKELENSASADPRAGTSDVSGEAAANDEILPEASPVAVPLKASPSAPNAASEVASGPSENRRITSKSAVGAADRCAVIDRLLSDLAAKLENLLSQSETTISVADTIDRPLEQATLEVIGSPGMADPQKDAAVQQLGALQESLKQDVGQEITPLKAHQIKQTVGNCLSADGSVVEEAKPGYRAVYDSLGNAIYAAVPKAKHLEERSANLLKMKVELENPPKAKEFTPAVA